MIAAVSRLQGKKLWTEAIAKRIMKGKRKLKLWKKKAPTML